MSHPADILRSQRAVFSKDLYSSDQHFFVFSQLLKFHLLSYSLLLRFQSCNRSLGLSQWVTPPRAGRADTITSSPSNSQCHHGTTRMLLSALSPHRIFFTVTVSYVSSVPFSQFSAFIPLCISHFCCLYFYDTKDEHNGKE